MEKSAACPEVRDGGGGSTEAVWMFLEASCGGEQEENGYQWSENPPCDLDKP